MSLTINDSKIKQSIESFFEKLEKLYPEHQVFALDAIDKRLREALSKLSKLTGCTTPVVFLEKYGYKMISSDEVKKIRPLVKYTPGNEPDIIKDKVDSAIDRLKEYYPDGIITKGLQSDHKNLANNLSGLYQWLGYPSLAEMLKAYGFQLQYANSGGGYGGRPACNHEVLIKTLQEKYSNEKKPRTLSKIIDANPHLASGIKTLQNTSNKLFGMSLTKYFEKIGILEKSDKPASQSMFICHEVLVDGQEASVLCVSIKGIKPRVGHRVEIRYSDGLAAIGQVINSRISVNENDLSTPKDEFPRIVRRILKKDYFVASVDVIDSPVLCAIDTQIVSKGDHVKMHTPEGLKEVTGSVIETCSIPYLKEKPESPCDIIQINLSGEDFAKREQRIKIIESKSLEAFVDEVLANEYPIGFPSGLKVHCSEQHDLNTAANKVKELLEKSVEELIEKVSSSLGEGNYLDHSFDSFPYEIINGDIVFSLEIGVFEEYGKNVRLHYELFKIGDVILKALRYLTSEYGQIPGATYEGIVSWTQTCAQDYNSSVLLCNTEKNEYAKELIINDDDFWDEYEFRMDF